MSRPPTDFHARAAASWDEPPDWIVALAEACSRESQAAVARQLGVSSSMLSQAIGQRYPAGLERLEEMVRGALMGETVTCPVLGDVRRDQCLSEQGKPFTTSSSVRTRLFRACRDGCPHSRLGKERS